MTPKKALSIIKEAKPVLKPAQFAEAVKVLEAQIELIDAIESKNGIALEILFKASENGIYRKMADGVTFFPPDQISVYLGHHIMTESGKLLYGCDYGDTWALTKEELL